MDVRGTVRIVAVNNGWWLAPFADILYACDFQWWERYAGVPDFAGLKLSQDPKVQRRSWGVQPIELVKNDDTLQLTHVNRVGWGGNGGFHALNLVAQFQPKRIVLVGYDMHLADGLHWHGPHPKGMNNPSAPNVERWRRVVDAAAEPLRRFGVDVVNASPTSALAAYPKMDFREAIRCC